MVVNYSAINTLRIVKEKESIWSSSTIQRAFRVSGKRLIIVQVELSIWLNQEFPKIVQKNGSKLHHELTSQSRHNFYNSMMETLKCN